MGDLIEIAKEGQSPKESMETKRLKIHRDNVLVKRDGAAKALHVSKVILADQIEKKYKGLAHYGTIIALGPAVEGEHKLGDYVIYGKYAGLEIPWKAGVEDEVLINEADILCTIIEEAAEGSSTSSV